MRLTVGRINVAPVSVVAAGLLAGQGLSFAVDGSFVPAGVQVGYGLVFGSGTALAAIGLVLIYRAARIINFSQAAYGLNATTLFLLLVTTTHWSYWLALPAALLATGVTSLLVELLILRRFASAPRLVLTVVTIVLLQLLNGVALLLPYAFGYRRPPDGRSGLQLPSAPAHTPFGALHADWGPARFTGDHAVLVVVTVLACAVLTVFLRRSRLGTAMRGASENGTRIEQLGISAGVLSAMVWLIVAILSSLGAILTATAGQQNLLSINLAAGGQSYSTLTAALAAAVIADFDDLPLAATAAIGLTMFTQCVQWVFNDSAVVDVAQFAIVLAVLLTRHPTVDRGAAAGDRWVGAEEPRPIPLILRPLPAVGAGLRRAGGSLIALIVGYPFVVSVGQLDIGNTYVIYGIVGISLVVLTGWAGQISLGHFAFVAVGAVVGGAVIGSAHLPFLVGLVAGTAAAAALAVAVGLPALRLQGLYLAVTTLTLAVAAGSALRSPLFLQDHLAAKVSRPSWIGLDMNIHPRAYFYLSVLLGGGVLIVAVRLRRSRAGRLLIALRDNERMAQAYGMHVVRTRLLAFALSGGMAGFAGVLYVAQQGAVTAESYGPAVSIDLFLMAVLGGLGSAYSVLAGALYFGTAATLFPGAAGALLSSGLGVLVVLLFFPSGLGALGYSARDSWLRRIAQRHRLVVPSLAGNAFKRGAEALVPISAPPAEATVPPRYRMASRIGEHGASQLVAKAWRY